MNIVRILSAGDYELARRKFYRATATASMLSRSVRHRCVELLAYGYDTIMTGQLPVCNHSHVEISWRSKDRPSERSGSRFTQLQAGLAVKEPLI